MHYPLDFDLVVHTADVEVLDANARCPATNLVADGFRGDIVVPAGAERTVPVHLQMAAAPDACQAASLPLIFTASGGPATPPPTTGGETGIAFTGLGDGARTFGAVSFAAIAVGLFLLGRCRERAR